MKRLLVVLVVAMLALGVGQAQAAGILDFNMDAVHPAGASISYAGGIAPLIGANISVDTVVGLNTPLNDGVTLALADAILNFETGNLTGWNSGNWFFGGGGTITVANGSTLLSGSFENAQVVYTGSVFKVTIATFVDTKDPKLLAFYGLPTDVPYLGNMNLSFNAVGAPPGSFDSTGILSGDITNTPIPEPGSMLLLGTGLFGLAGAVRRRFKK